MGRLVAALLFMPLSCNLLLAQDSEQLRSCMDAADTQHEMHVCASEEARRVDAELNETYRLLLSAAANSPYEPEALEKISIAEKAWVAYRDAYIEARYPARNKQAIYGTVFPMAANLLRAKLTRQHIEALSGLLRHYNGEPDL